MSINEANATLRNFIATHFPRSRARGLSDEDPLLASGVVDSLGVLDLVSFIESEFGISVTDDDLLPENFNSIGRIVTFIKDRQAKTGISAG
jgi:acyl carrier protein